MFKVTFQNRDFTHANLPTASFAAERFSFTAFGGCDQALIRARAQPEDLLILTNLLRCPITISDPFGDPLWWGFVNEIIINFEKSQIKVSLERLFNKIKVTYSFISPDNKLGDQLETTIVNNTASQSEYGIKEYTVHRQGIDDDFANSLRDTLLNLHAWPKSNLSQNLASGHSFATLKCQGWFKTLAWQTYASLDGFNANYGPGAGAYQIDTSTSQRQPAQLFYHRGSASLQYAWFPLLAVGGVTRNLYAQVRQHTAGTPGTILATSNPVNSGFHDSVYRWIKFTFPAPLPTLAANTYYWLTLDSSGVSSTQYYTVRIDENQTSENVIARFFNGTNWQLILSVTNPGSRPQIIFRVVCVQDTGTQLSSIATAGNQFFSSIHSLSTGVLTTPYRQNFQTCLQEVEALMHLGTVNQRLILANILPGRQLYFSEQPDHGTPTIYMDRYNRFYTKEASLLPAYRPPVGQFAALSGTDRIMHPFDKPRTPASFIAGAEYYPPSGKVRIKAG